MNKTIKIFAYRCLYIFSFLLIKYLGEMSQDCMIIIHITFQEASKLFSKVPIPSVCILGSVCVCVLIFISLAMLGLSCSRQDLASLCQAGSLLATCELLVLAYGI